MTRSELVDTALKGVGKARVSGDTFEPIMPYLLADIMYQIYIKAVHKNSLKHKMKQMDTCWRKRYGLFNRPIFSCFEDAGVELTDMMDSVYQMLENDITLMRTRIVGVLNEIDKFEDKMLVASLILCHIFAEYAECSYGNCYYRTVKTFDGYKEVKDSNKDLCYLRDLSYKMAFQYIKDLPGGEITIYHPSMDDLFGRVAKKIYGWLKEN